METFERYRITAGRGRSVVKVCWTSRLLLRLCNSSLIRSVIDQVVMSDERKRCGKKNEKTIFKGINHTDPNSPE